MSRPIPDPAALGCEVTGQRIVARNLVIACHVGYPEEERAGEQELRFDVELTVDALRPLDPTQLDPARRVILAFDPGLPLDRIMAVYAELAHPDIVISALDARWREALGRVSDEVKR